MSIIKWADDLDFKKYKPQVETIEVEKTPEEEEISKSPKDMEVKFYDSLTRRRKTPYTEEEMLRLEKDPTHGGQLTRVFNALQKQIADMEVIEAKLKEIKEATKVQTKPLEEQKIKLKEDIGSKVRNLTEYLLNAQDGLEEMVAENNMVVLEYKKMLLYIINQAQDKISKGVPESEVIKILMHVIQTMGTQEMLDTVTTELDKAVAESEEVAHSLQRELFMAREPESAKAKSTKSKGKTGDISSIVTWVKNKFNSIYTALNNSLTVLKGKTKTLEDAATQLEALTPVVADRKKIIKMTRYLMEF